MSNKKIPIIFDMDPGHDDAIGLIVAAASEKIEVKAITTVAGNQTLPKVTYNAQRMAALLHLDCPIAKGREIPLMCDLQIAPSYHGETGLDGTHLPEPAHPLSELSAVELMAKVLRESDEKVTIVATGPQTNVAELLIAHPELKEKIERISIMGGGLRNGNWTAGAEFNIIVDPEAAWIEYHSGVPLIQCGLDVTEQALIYPEEWNEIRKQNNPVATVFADLLDFFFIFLKSLGWSGATLHDPCAVLMLIHPEIFETKDLYVDIETKGAYMRGATIADYKNKTGNKPNCKAVVGIDREAFVKCLAEACAKFKDWKV